MKQRDIRVLETALSLYGAKQLIKIDDFISKLQEQDWNKLQGRAQVQYGHETESDIELLKTLKALGSC